MLTVCRVAGNGPFAAGSVAARSGHGTEHQTAQTARNHFMLDWKHRATPERCKPDNLRQGPLLYPPRKHDNKDKFWNCDANRDPRGTHHFNSKRLMAIKAMSPAILPAEKAGADDLAR